MLTEGPKFVSIVCPGFRLDPLDVETKIAGSLMLSGEIFSLMKDKKSNGFRKHLNLGNASTEKTRLSKLQR